MSTGIMILLIILLIIVFRKWIGFLFIAIIFSFSRNNRRDTNKFWWRLLIALLISAIMYLLIKF